ncbi:hypothetical protein RTH46_11095 [Pseudomonas sp. zfem004]|uniref:DUF6543 domain-containing protein n=1 Tax=Pseudomonas sp. zfem004 TaxID=3078199 RepID=UPI002927E140|nr:DUF6543 domain-containing protein [Pseudomonas sp. zfem004]MDU9403034.1 hypothetical protein [Pseudomonas sp. zfem004]
MSNTTSISLKQACARQFADRPTLRQVASQQILKLLATKFAWIAEVQPALDDADPIMLDSPVPDADYWGTAPLVDVVLQALLGGAPMNLEALGARTYNLGVEDPYRFPASHSALDTRALHGVTEAFNDLVRDLPAAFCQAQVDFWNAAPCLAPDDCGVSRHRWMQQALRTALLGSAQVQSLTEEARTCLYELLGGRTASMQINAIEVTMSVGQEEQHELLPDLLVSLERDETRLMICCQPSGQVHAYTSLDAFAIDLRDRLAYRHRFDRLSWSRYALEGEPLLQQSGLLLGWMLSRLDHLPWLSIDSVEQLEAWFAQLSDPSTLFFEAAYFDEQAPGLAVPDWLVQASSQDRFEYQTAMLDLAVEQALSKGQSSLDGVLDLHAYSREHLRQQMLADYPQEANYFADDLILTVQSAQGVPGGVATGPGDGVVTRRTLSLTEFAIGNLAALEHGGIVAIAHRHGQLIADWMTADYVQALVGRVDIGGHYPAYLSTALSDPLTRDARIRCFAREWRSQLLFDALKLKVRGGLDLEAWQVLAEFCRGNLDLKSTLDIAPLAFAVPGYRRLDTVTCMFVIRLRQSQVLLLYRPLYADAPLRQFADADALMHAIDQDVALQGSVLQWLGDEARAIYGAGGFTRPHRITGWQEAAGGVLVPIYEAFESLGNPARLSFQPWLADTDINLFMHKLQAMVDLARRQVVSNAQSRWQRLLEGGWLLFNIVTPLLRGPIAAVTWLALLLAAVNDDAQALEHGSDAERSLAVLDLIANLSMLLGHVGLPQARQPVPPAPPLDIARPQGVPALAAVPVQMGRTHLPGALQDVEVGPVVHATGWGPGPAAQLKALRHLAATVELRGIGEDAEGYYRHAGERYVMLYGERFQVRQWGEQVRVVGPEGQLGPWLWRGEQWKVREGFFGGMPKGRGRGASRQSQYDHLGREMNANIDEGERLRQRIVSDTLQVIELDEKLDLHEQSLADVVQNRDGAFTSDQAGKLATFHRQQIALKSAQMDDMRRSVIANLQQAVETDRSVMDKIPQLLELQRFRDVRAMYTEENFRAYLEAARNMLVINSWNIFDELRRLADYPELHRLSGILNGRPVADVLDDYRLYRRYLANTVGSQASMLKASLDLDAFLPQIAPETLLISTSEPITAQRLVSFRTIPSVQLRFHQAMNYADLALHLDQLGHARQLIRYRDALAGETLKSAASAHAGLSTGNLSAADRIEILQTAWDEYSTAIINGLDIAGNGGRLVELDRLGQYAEELKALKRMVSEQLVEAIAEQDGVPPPARYPAYVTTQARQLPVRTGKGVLVIATPVETGLEVREPFTDELLHRFAADDAGGWIEVVDSTPAPVQAVDDARAQAESLLAEHGEMERMAREYVDGDVRSGKLTRLLDGYLDALRVAVDGLSGVVDGAGLLERLQAQIELWSQRRTALLVELFDKTRHPDALALAFMHEQGLIRVEYQSGRRQIADGSAMDEYRVLRLARPGDGKGRALWVAHFHFEHADDGPTAFTRGHLKTWQQRFYGREDAQKLAAEGQRIHRGPITYAQVKDIIPFLR